MSKASYQDSGPENMKSQLDGWTRHNCTRYAAGELSAQATASGDDTYGDTEGDQDDTRPMSEISREELNAKLEAVEARMDGRVASIEGKIDAFLAAQTHQQRFNEHRFDSYEKSVGEMRNEIKTDLKSLRSTIIVTAVSTVLAIVIGVAGFNATLTSNMLSAFQFGKTASSAPPVIPVSK